MIISADMDVCVEYVLDGFSRASKNRACMDRMSPHTMNRPRAGLHRQHYTCYSHKPGLCSDNPQLCSMISRAATDHHVMHGKGR